MNLYNFAKCLFTSNPLYKYKYLYIRKLLEQFREVIFILLLHKFWFFFFLFLTLYKKLKKCLLFRFVWSLRLSPHYNARRYSPIAMKYIYIIEDRHDMFGSLWHLCLLYTDTNIIHYIRIYDEKKLRYILMMIHYNKLNKSNMNFSGAQKNDFSGIWSAYHLSRIYRITQKLFT